MYTVAVSRFFALQVLSALWPVLLLPSRSWPLVTHALKPLHKLAAQAGLTPLQDHSLLEDNLIAGGALSILLAHSPSQQSIPPNSTDACTS